MPTAFIPLIAVAVAVFVQRNLLTCYDYECPRCASTFSPSAVSLALAPHRLGGNK